MSSRSGGARRKPLASAGARTTVEAARAKNGGTISDQRSRLEHDAQQALEHRDAMESAWQKATDKAGTARSLLKNAQDGAANARTMRAFARTDAERAKATRTEQQWQREVARRTDEVQRADKQVQAADSRRAAAAARVDRAHATIEKLDRREYESTKHVPRAQDLGYALHRPPSGAEEAAARTTIANRATTTAKPPRGPTLTAARAQLRDLNAKVSAAERDVNRAVNNPRDSQDFHRAYMALMAARQERAAVWASIPAETRAKLNPSPNAQDEYFAHEINYNGVPMSRGNAIHDMQSQGVRQQLIDRYLQGQELGERIREQQPQQQQRATTATVARAPRGASSTIRTSSRRKKVATTA